MTINNNVQRGRQGERKALEYLFNNNYSFIGNNWQRREGEIDLIVWDNWKEILVFVEVKARNSTRFGSIEESITEKKKIKLNDIINRYVSEKNYRREYRFDFIGIVNNKIIHYKNVEI